MTIRTLAHALVDARLVEEADIPSDNQAALILRGGVAANIAQAGPIIEVTALVPVPELVRFIEDCGSEVNMILLEREERKGA